MAYGQTGSGKTYLMHGQLETDARRGLAPRASRAIFDRLSRAEGDWEVCACAVVWAGILTAGVIQRNSKLLVDATVATPATGANAAR